MCSSFSEQENPWALTIAERTWYHEKLSEKMCSKCRCGSYKTVKSLHWRLSGSRWSLITAGCCQRDVRCLVCSIAQNSFKHQYYISTSLFHRYSNVCPLFLEQPISYHVLRHQNPFCPQDKNKTGTLDSSPLLSLSSWLGSPLPSESFQCLLNKLPNFFIHYSYFRPSQNTAVVS